ncbi:MAG: thymidine kinase [Bacillota bacterium]|nr:thymidine kinase [Bacillota bacterium]
MPGRLEVVTGCMFAGKSEELLRRLRRAIIARKGVLLVKPDIDWRYGRDQVVSHDGQRLDAQPLPTDRSELLLELADRRRPEVVGVDEAQFFSPALIGVVERLVRQGLRVIVAGLDMDFAGRPFGPMPQLMAMADEVSKLQAVCVVCGEPAVLTQRLIDGRPAPADAPVIAVGGAESYEARCRRHHQLA